MCHGKTLYHALLAFQGMLTGTFSTPIFFLQFIVVVNFTFNYCKYVMNYEADTRM